MASIWRTGLPLLRTKASNATIPSITHARTTQKLPVRLYSQGSYGGESSDSKQSKSTRQKEHPGPPAPDVGQNPSNADKTSSQGSSSSSSSSPSSKPRKDQTPSQQPHSATTHEAPHDPVGPEVHDTPHIPSNKAHPTVSTGQQSPYYDEDGRQVKEIPEDVKRHNEEVEQRHDRSFNQLTNKGKVQKGF